MTRGNLSLPHCSNIHRVAQNASVADLIFGNFSPFLPANCAEQPLISLEPPQRQRKFCQSLQKPGAHRKASAQKSGRQDALFRRNDSFHDQFTLPVSAKPGSLVAVAAALRYSCLGQGL